MIKQIRRAQALAIAAAIRNSMSLSERLGAVVLFIVLALGVTLVYHVVIGGAKESECRRECARQGHGYYFASPLTAGTRTGGTGSPLCKCLEITAAAKEIPLP